MMDTDRITPVVSHAEVERIVDKAIGISHMKFVILLILSIAFLVAGAFGFVGWMRFCSAWSAGQATHSEFQSSISDQ